MKNESMKRTVVITGASRGIGRATALAFGQEKWNVVVGYARQAELAAEVVTQIRELGGEAVAIPLDQGRVETIPLFFQHAIEAFGGLDVLVNNAAVNLREDALEPTEKTFAALFDVNVKGLYFCSAEAARLMLRAPAGRSSEAVPIRGRIINVSAVPARTFAPAGMALYASTKAAVDSLTRSLAAHWGPRGILVNAVAPGITDTDIIRHDRPELVEQLRHSSVLGRLGRPQDAARAITYLAEDEWMVGQSLNTSGGRFI